MTAKKKENKTLKIKLLKSPNKRGKAQIATVKGLGLRRIGHEVEIVITPSNQGMISAVSHLISISE